MFYSFEVTVSANTSEDDADEQVLNLSQGVITQVCFRPRPGHAALCHCRVFYRRHQIYPTNADSDFHGDTFPIESPEWFELDEDPAELTLVSWNDDDTYEHTFDISFTILPRKAVLALAVADAIKSFFGSLFPTRIPIPSWLGGKKEE